MFLPPQPSVSPWMQPGMVGQCSASPRLCQSSGLTCRTPMPTVSAVSPRAPPQALQGAMAVPKNSQPFVFDGSIAATSPLQQSRSTLHQPRSSLRCAASTTGSVTAAPWLQKAASTTAVQMPANATHCGSRGYAQTMAARQSVQPVFKQAPSVGYANGAVAVPAAIPANLPQHYQGPGIIRSMSPPSKLVTNGAFGARSSAPSMNSIKHKATATTRASLQVEKGTNSQTFTNSHSLALKLKGNGDFTISGRPIILQVEKSQRSHTATGLNVWDAGISLAKYFEFIFSPSAGVLGGGVKKRALELGCGTGVAGLSLAFLGYDVTLSDIGADQAQATQANIAMNERQIVAAGGHACYTEIDWKKLPARETFGQFDVVLCSDVVWHESLVDPLVKAVAWAASGQGFREFFLGHKVRDQESIASFEQEMAKNGFIITKVVETKEILGQWGHPDVIVYHAMRA